MTEHETPQPASDPEQPSGEPPHHDPALRANEVATRIGRLIGRTAHRARELGEEAAREARPEAERLAHATRDAVERARPLVEQAGRDAVRYVREHDQEIKRIARVSAEVTAHQVMPGRLRPIVAALEAERWQRAPLRDARSTRDPAAPPTTPPSPPDEPASEEVPRQ